MDCTGAADEVDKTVAATEKRKPSQSQPGCMDDCKDVGAGCELVKKLQLSRVMLPDDANIMGNVHGGIILKMIEEAGSIVGTRHCNAQNGDRCLAALVRVEKTEFLSPVFIGEVVHVSAEITYTSKHSLEVQVKVIAENILTGAKKLANKAALWYVPCSLQNVDKITEVPPIEYASAEKEEEGRKRYEAQKIDRMETKARGEEVMPPRPNPEDAAKERHTVGFSQSSLIHLVGPSDCTVVDFVYGGVAMKLMDEVAGIVAARHCNTNIVTASVDAINFHRKIRKGCVVTVTGRLTFVSNRSMEIEVLVDADSLMEKQIGKYRAVSAFFTFISLDKENKPLNVPPLKIEGDDEQKRFEEGKSRYLQNKARRLAEKERQQ
ncbi:cytosolic acyl coenzyme A thioester hydrolase isoform X1 [Xiphophorus couchianus]|uniref:cytosolic acyl coenzyme A thioester hydrolase isoform X1 n=1 Tax=Xiphophorus couchianus TaxID=32473 RepID=UPI001015DB41|nr:cytosolic acyl coenzyme A thioester hydrolase isoform X1 [Xiphophorus couchianus]